jgi:hypothetical protein
MLESGGDAHLALEPKACVGREALAPLEGLREAAEDQLSAATSILAPRLGCIVSLQVNVRALVPIIAPR